jgi:hypothetical protein
MRAASWAKASDRTLMANVVVQFGVGGAVHSAHAAFAQLGSYTILAGHALWNHAA